MVIHPPLYTPQIAWDKIILLMTGSSFIKIQLPDLT